jgi:hypothetical protein
MILIEARRSIGNSDRPKWCIEPIHDAAEVPEGLTGEKPG